MVTDVSIYFHIPFCTRKCDYCHFYVIPDKQPLKDTLMRGLELEWNQVLPHIKDKRIVSIYFGGGTPSLLGAPYIDKILSWVRSDCNIDTAIEITLEANPEHITQELISSYALCGINRLSIGVQTFDDTLLTRLSRTHDAKKAIVAIETAYLSGIHNISIDLMYDLPGQTLPVWKKTLHTAVELPITHLSLYNLTIEPHTVFYKKQKEIKLALPDEETSLQMYLKAVEVLEKHQLYQYEISAFAKNGCESKHNKGYWTARPFFGLGPSAFSYWNNKRFRNICNLNKYVHLLEQGLSPVDFEEILPFEKRQNELLAVRLRLKEGVDLHLFELSEETDAALRKLEQEGFISSSGSQVRLTERGILFYDTVASELI